MDWIKCLKEHRRIFRAHAIRRMFERNIVYGELVEALEEAEVIEEYPDDHPYPSCLILGFTRSKKTNSRGVFNKPQGRSRPFYYRIHS